MAIWRKFQIKTDIVGNNQFTIYYFTEENEVVAVRQINCDLNT